MVSWGRKKVVDMKRTFSQWLIIILIILFFAIPVASLAINEPIMTWPKCSTSFVYNFFLK